VAKSLTIELREEATERLEVVGLDDALIELSLQKRFLSQQAPSQSLFGIDYLIKAQE